MKILLIATLIQSFIIIFCAINSSFQVLIDRLFVQEITELRNGYMGGLACIASYGAIRFSLGLVACVYFLFKKNNIIYFLLFLYLGIVCFTIARTGLIFLFLGLIFIFINSYKNYYLNNIIKYLFICTLIVVLFIILVSIFDLTNEIEKKFYRLIDLFKGDGIRKFFSEYFYGENTSYAKHPVEVLFGTGLISGTSKSGTIVNIDGGYLRVYSAIGLPLCIMTYFVIYRAFYNLIKNAKKEIRIPLIFFNIIIIFAEFKEYSLYVEFLVCIYFVICFLGVYKPVSDDFVKLNV